MPNLSLIANSGIQLFTFSIRIEKDKGKPMLFHEWYDREDGKRKLDIVSEIITEHEPVYVRKIDLGKKGYLVNPADKLDWNLIREDNVKALKIGEKMVVGVPGDIFPMAFRNRFSKMEYLENVWLPVPYFLDKTEKRQLFGPLNWSRFKLLKRETQDPKYDDYDVILAFDTRSAQGENDEYNEAPVFSENFGGELQFSVSKNEFFTTDYCLPDRDWSYIDNYIRKLVYPEINDVKLIKEEFKCSYIASYIYLINYISRNGLFPQVTLYRDTDVKCKEIDMVVDVGNSKTTALLVEDNRNFNQIQPLKLQDFTDILVEDDQAGEGHRLNKHSGPFDMRVAFRRADFGRVGIEDSRQFVHPSLVRLGQEANKLIHCTIEQSSGQESVSTNSSPKRYLWDGKKSAVNWEFVVLPGESRDTSILNLPGITNQLNSDGTLDLEGKGGVSYKYSRRSLMTFSFLEMIAQAHAQVNSYEYRILRGSQNMARRIKRIIITCPTTMSEVERVALVKSARDAVVLFDNFKYKDVTENKSPGGNIEVIPTQSKRSLLDDQEYKWYYDEASCAQFVYIYAEIAKRYGSHCNEFFKLYGKKRDGDDRESLIVGSLDIGAGTSDLMISKYSYTNNGIVAISPEPLFYDSFYYAGDDMMKMLILNLIIEGENSALRKSVSHLSPEEYNSVTTRFFGGDYNGQSFEERMLRRDFTLQVSVPLIQHFLGLMQKEEDHTFVSYDEVFGRSELAPNERVLRHFEKFFGVDFTTLQWEFDKEHIGQLIERAFDQEILKQVAAIMFAHSCDIVILSGRPTSLPPIEKIFLNYYPVAPNRLILLNKFQIGNWYPFNDHNGYISDPKTIVAVGAMIGHYGSELANLDGFTLKLDKLGEKIKSTANFLEDPNAPEYKNQAFILTSDKNSGKVSLKKLPQIIRVSQLSLPTYPKKSLFTIDFNREKMAQAVWARAEQDGTDLTPAAVEQQVGEKMLQIRKSMPLHFEIERGSTADDREHLRIVSVEDENGRQLSVGDFEISIQSLGAQPNYWLDTGIIKEEQ